MTEIKPYIQGQPIESVEKTRVYVHKDVLKHLELYQDIGTISQLRALKEERDKYFLEIQSYRAIGTLEEFKALKEKNEPKKPRVWANGTKHCANEDCEEVVFTSDEYCLHCGQKLDWE